jgi:hypothetical protein
MTGRLSSQQNTSSYSCLIAAWALLFLLLPSDMLAQGPSATLRGVALDETNALVRDVVVVVSNVDDDAQRRTTTDRNGSFVVSFLRPGRYKVTATREGFATAELNDVVLNVNDQVSIDVRLKVQGGRELVTVTAEPGRVSTSSSVGTAVGGTFLATMPLNGRSLHSLLQLVPGVVLTTASGGVGATGVSQFSINGQRTTSNYFMVDGVSANTGMSVGTTIVVGSAGAGAVAGTNILGGTNSLASLDAIQEFRIETSGYAPEFGHYTGGQVSLVTRSGSNIFRGSAAEYFRHDALDANDWFANSHNQPKARERQYIFSGVFGGPLKRDLAYFFLSYENVNLELPKSTVVSVPDLATRAAAPPALRPYLNALPLPNGSVLAPGFAEFVASYSDPASSSTAAVRVDGHLGSRTTAFVRVNHAPSELETRSQALSTVGRLRASNDTVTGGATWIVTDRVTADARANWSRNNPHQVSRLEAFGGAIVPDAQSIFLPTFDPGNAFFLFYGANNPGFVWGQGTSNTQRQVNVNGAASGLFANHELKAGFDVRRMTPTIRGGTTNQEQVYFTDAAAIISGRPLFYSITLIEPTPREPILTNVSLFLQDTWRVGRRLTLNYGLRFERLASPGVQNELFPRSVIGIENGGISNPSLAPPGTPLWRSRIGEFGPRAGVVYRLNENATWATVVRGGVGIFHDSGVGSIINEFSNAYPFRADAGVNASVFPPDPSLRVPPVLPPSVATGVFYALDPRFRMPYTRQWNIALEEMVHGRDNVTISYIGTQGRDLLIQQTVPTQLQENPGQTVFLSIQRNGASANYHALQVQAQRRVSRSLQYLASYTLSRSRDNASDDTSSSPINVVSLLSREWGPSDFDVRHVVSGAVTYQVDLAGRTHIWERVLNGFGADLLLRAQSALPLNPIVDTKRADGVTRYSRRPDAVAGQSLYFFSSNLPGGQRLNSAAFTTPAGDQGTFPRNGARGLPVSQIDVAVHREIRLRGIVKVQVKAELFNVLNHSNFGSTDLSLSSATFGQPQFMLNRSLGGLNPLYQMGGPRSGQVEVKVMF